MITIKVDAADVIADCSRSPELTRRIVVRGLNRAIVAARTVMSRAIAKDTGLKVGDVRDALRTDKANFSKPVAELAASLSRIPLIKFNANGPEPSRGKGTGVSYKLSGSRERVATAFIATMASGHRGVFVRVGRKRLPIRELLGPSLGHVFLKYQDAAIQRAVEAFGTTVDHEFQFEAALPTDPDPTLAEEAAA